MIRELIGMTYKSIDIEHPVSMSMSEVLFKAAHWASENEVHGLLTGIHTGIHPDDDKKFITNLVWAI